MNTQVASIIPLTQLEQNVSNEPSSLELAALEQIEAFLQDGELGERHLEIERRLRASFTPEQHTDYNELYSVMIMTSLIWATAAFRAGAALAQKPATSLFE